MKSRNKFWFLTFTFLSVWIGACALGIYRTQNGSNDFDTFYTAGKAVLEKSGIYYIGEYYQMRSNVGPFLYPPIAACFFSLFAFFSMPIAAVIWTSLLFVLFVATIFLIFDFLGIRYNEIPNFWCSIPIIDRIFWSSISIILFIDNLVMLQINILVFFICLLCLVLWKKKQNFLAGFILSIAILLKLTPALFCLYFVTRKAWKLLLGVLIGSLIFTIVIPTAIFGRENNRLYHRQWFGKMIKPGLIDMFEKISPQSNTMNKSAEEMRQIATDQSLIDTNQSLEGALNRLLLKDRKNYFATHRYKNLAPLGGGISREMLGFLMMFIRFSLLGVCVYLWTKKSHENNLKVPLDISLVFLTMTLLSPVTRSHYYIVWIFVYLTLFYLRLRLKNISQIQFFFKTAAVSACVYLMLALPYGAAVGTGAWSNLIFWIGCAYQLKTS